MCETLPAIAPGPVYTPLITSTFSKDNVKGIDSTPIGRPSQPVEVACAAVFLASGQFITVLRRAGQWLTRKWRHDRGLVVYLGQHDSRQRRDGHLLEQASEVGRYIG